MEMIENVLKTDQGKLAAQFFMGQRYIKALKGQAKSTNTLLVNQDLSFVPKQVEDSVNVVGMDVKSKK